MKNVCMINIKYIIINMSVTKKIQQILTNNKRKKNRVKKMKIWYI